MAKTTTIARVERLVWILIYGGMLCAVLGFAMRDAASDAGGALVVFGAIAAAVGVVLIFVRARMHDDGP